MLRSEGFCDGGAAVAGHTADPPVTPAGGAYGGVLKGGGTADSGPAAAVQIARSIGEEIPQ